MEGSYDDIYVYKLENGKPVKIQFLSGDELKDTWLVSNPMSFRLVYSTNEEFKLVTHYRNLWSGPVNVYRIWNLEQDKFMLERTVGDIVE